MDFVNAEIPLVKQLTFLSGIDPKELAHTLGGEIREEPFREGQTIFTQDEPATATFFILSGEVTWTREKDPTIHGVPRLSYHLGENQLLGQYGLLYNKPYPMTAVGSSAGRLLRMENHALNRLIYRFPELRRGMMPIDIISRLSTVPWLAELDEMDIGLLAEEVEILKLPADYDIYNRDEFRPNTFFIIDQGQVRLLHPRAADDIGYLGNGAVFGVSPMLPDGPSRYQNIAETLCPSIIYALPRAILDDAARHLPKMREGDQRQQRASALGSTQLFSRLDKAERERLAGYCSHYNIPHPHLITLQNEPSNCLWLLMPGSTATLHVLERNGDALPPKKVSGPLHFGEAALLMENPISSSIEAHTNSQWLRLSRKDFLAFVDSEQDDIMAKLSPNPTTAQLRQRSTERKRYPWLGSGEVVLLEKRRHWLILLQKLVPWVVISVVLMIFVLSVRFLVDPTNGFVWLVSGAGLVSLLVFLWGAEDYRNDYLVVTNQRVVQQDKVILINERRRAAPLNQIQNIDVFTDFFGNFLKYGRLIIHTASTEGDIIFDFAPDPESMRGEIMRQIQQRRTGYRAQGKMEIQNMLEARLGIKLSLPERVVRAGDNGDPTSTVWWLGWWVWLKSQWTTESSGWEEKAQIIWHKHWAVLLTKIFTPILVIIFAVVLAVGGFSPGIRQAFAVFDAIEITAALIGLVGLLWAMWIFADWRNDTYELTDMSLIDVEKMPLALSANRRVAQLSEIQDIELDVPSPIHAILRFGNVKVRTAASQGLFTFDSVPDPQGVAEEIRRRMEAWRVSDERRQAINRAKELPDWFEIYKRLDSDRDTL